MGSIRAELEELGFAPAGGFRKGRFELADSWAARPAVYIWTRDDAVVLRVGIACGRGGLRARYASYNRWLAGRHKPEVAFEQEKARLFRLRLDDSCRIWARTVPDKAVALGEEAELRRRFGPALELDLMTRGWAKRELAAWRRGRSSSAVPPKARPQPVRDAMTTPPLRPVTRLDQLFGSLEDLLLSEGFTAELESRGWRYVRPDRRRLKLHPKPTKGCLRVFVGEDNARAAPEPLRNPGRQPGWLLVWPDDADLARAYVAKCLRD